MLDRLWQRLGIDTAIRAALGSKRVDDQRAERILFALVANRAVKPSSKLAATDWLTHDVPQPTAWPRLATMPATGRWTRC